MKRKIICFVLLVFLVAMLAIPALAAGSANLTVSDSTPYRGDTFTVTVNLSGVGTCAAGSVEIAYGSGLEWTGAKSLISGVTVDYKLDQGKIIFYSMSGADINGKLLSLTFKVKSNAAFDANKIEVSLNINGESIKASKNVNVTCNHKYSAWTSASGDKHSRTCSICGTKDSKAHTYDNACDVDCNDCGATRVTEHSFAEEWTSNESGHWHLCVHCGAESTLEEHVPGAPAGEYTDQICTVCQEVLVPALGHQHSYDGTYKTDGTFHWTKCLGCGEETEKVTHGYEDDCDETCDACGYVRAVVHKTSDNWTCDGVKHWKTCTDCGLKLEENAHVWDGGTVTLEPTGTSQGKILYRCGLCHTERIEDIPALQLTDALPWWLWMLIGAGCGAVLVLGIQLVIGLSKSTHKGRYSG
jgi:hypothetical protein